MHRLPDTIIWIIAMAIGVAVGIYCCHRYHLVSFWGTFAVCVIGVTLYTAALHYLTQLTRAIERRHHARQSPPREMTPDETIVIEHENSAQTTTARRG